MPVTLIYPDGTVSKQEAGVLNAKIYPLVCDRLTLTCDFPDQQKNNIKTCFKQEKAWSQSGYKLSSKINDLPMTMPPYQDSEKEKITSAFIQCDPFNTDDNFLRLDFNPAKIEMDVLRSYINTNWLTQKGFGFDYLFANCRITRIDLAVDIAYERVNKLYYYYPKMQVTEVHSKSGQTHYLGGKTKTGKTVVVYDRLPAIKAHNAKKYYNPKLQMPKLEYDVLRVEIRLFPKVSLADLLNIPNPFQKLVISACSLPLDDPMWDMFLALARYEGAQAALCRLPDKYKKQKYVKHMEGDQPNWWAPEKIWNQYPQVLQSIINPTY